MCLQQLDLTFNDCSLKHREISLNLLFLLLPPFLLCFLSSSSSCSASLFPGEFIFCIRMLEILLRGERWLVLLLWFLLFQCKRIKRWGSKSVARSWIRNGVIEKLIEEMSEMSCSFADCLLIFKSSLSFNSGSIQSNILKTQMQSLAVTKEILPNCCLLRTMVMFLGHMRHKR